ncbi:agamous-like protein MADS-box protein [Gossypium australe]|uniref:Agamous-like protein MADS-box protein n=1 Tax=Gossypium australe TaxID=47621 RepID=A0A5B6WLB2_9ROSI|nr:agamous-like protein MADS-box protein [Gossypium australe]
MGTDPAYDDNLQAMSMRKIKRIDNPCYRQIAYSKRGKGILKKATELSTLCGADVGLLMFEDIFLRYMDPHDDFSRHFDNEEESLKHLKYEAEILDKIERLETLESKLCELNRKIYEAQEKMRSYSPDVSNIYSIAEAQHHQQFVTKAIQRIEKLNKTKLLEKETSHSL